MTALTETAHAGEFIAVKANGDLSFEQGTLKSGNNLVAGTLVGFIPSATVSSAAKSGSNTGNGTLVVDATTPALPFVKEGVYSLRFTTTTSMRLEDPDGIVLGDITIGGATGNSTTVAEQIKGLVTQGSATFAAGDGFDISVSAVSGKYTSYNPAGTDGSQIAAGFIYASVDATSADKRATFFVRNGAVNGNIIVWPAAVTTAAQKAVAKAQLKLPRVGIVVR